MYDEGNKLPNFSESKANDAVATEPDWATVKLNVVLSPFVNVIVLMFTDAVTIAFGVFDAVCACTAVEAVAAYEAEVTLPHKNEAVKANDAVATLILLVWLLSTNAVEFNPSNKSALAAYEAVGVATSVNWTELIRLALNPLNIAGVICPELLLGKSLLFWFSIEPDEYPGIV